MGEEVMKREKDYSCIGYIRKNTGKKQQDLAKEAGISQSLLSKIEKGKVKNPTHQTIGLIAKALGMTTDQLDEACTAEETYEEYEGRVLEKMKEMKAQFARQNIKKKTKRIDVHHFFHIVGPYEDERRGDD
jgi:transcriptional regulator with XRE-family HTH domain